MNWAHLHLLLNHIPVLGTLFGLALLVWGAFRHNDSIQRAALGAFLIVALVAIPVFLTGEPSEQAVEQLAGTAEGAIETHQDAAVLSLIAVEALGLIGLVGLVIRRTRFTRLVTPAALVFAIITAGLMARTANLGGRIRHSELRASGGQEETEHEERGEGR